MPQNLSFLRDYSPFAALAPREREMPLTGGSRSSLACISSNASRQKQERRGLLLGAGQCGPPRPWGGKRASRRFARVDRFPASRSKPPPERVDFPQRQPGTGTEPPLTQLDASGLDNRSRDKFPAVPR